MQAAAELGEQVLEQSGVALGEDHPSTLFAAANLAFDLMRLGRIEEAARMREMTIAVLARVVGAEHPVASDARRSVRIDCEADTMQL
ncbi:MAG: tetratricopeptide repeat protein [Kibdelosporangium sp.]